MNSPVPGRLPWWTWILPLLVFQLATLVAGYFKTPAGSSVLYLTMASGILMVNWWGWRVALLALLSTWINMFSYDIPTTASHFLFSLRGPLSILLSWVLFRVVLKGDCRLHSLNQLLYFITGGILLPLLINAGLRVLQSSGLEDRWEFFISFLLPDVLTNLALTVPVMLLLAHPLMARGWIVNPSSVFVPRPPVYPGHWLELVALSLLLLLFSLVVPFNRFWFLFGIFSIYSSIRFGLRVVALVNASIFLFTYVLPVFFERVSSYRGATFYDIELGMALLFVFSLLTARIMKDLRLTREQMVAKNNELQALNENLKKANTELDQFVYSVSHDLIAPLKSIKGLVNLSRLENDPLNTPVYLSKIGTSAQRLDDFIREVLDYSRSKRKELVWELIDLQKLLRDIYDHLQYQEGAADFEVTFRLEVPVLICDATRLRIILNNLIANAIKYHPRDGSRTPQLEVVSTLRDGGICLDVTDNGAGIDPALHQRIFEMFYRGDSQSSGSGLGLYIAREAAEKIQARIHVQSEPGAGSTFTVVFPPQSTPT